MDTHSSNIKKINFYNEIFYGLKNVYGTYDPKTGKSWQVKAPVTEKVIHAHLTGNQPYGVYLLVEDETSAVVVDFDTFEEDSPRNFVNCAKHYKIPAYIERSKSKGYHVWIFLEKKGIHAAKARMVAQYILNEIEQSNIEIFPKQNQLDNKNRYGNFINAPLFGKLVQEGKTAFIDPVNFTTYPDQWRFLSSVKRVSETTLDDIIEINNIKEPVTLHKPVLSKKSNFSALPPCAIRMLEEGVTKFQRISCFRLAVNLKRIGLPYEYAEIILSYWAMKNNPVQSKKIISNKEIINQTAYTYSKDIRGFGCGSEAINPYCDPECRINLLRNKNKTLKN